MDGNLFQILVEYGEAEETEMEIKHRYRGQVSGPGIE